MAHPHLKPSLSLAACPACGEPLQSIEHQGVALDLCRKQCGLWFDAEELTRVEQSDTLNNLDVAFAGEYEPPASRLDVQDALDNPSRHCPKDGEELQRYEWNLGSGLVLDRCQSCHGIWMDGGELEGYAEHVKRFREKPPELTPELKAKLALVSREVDLAHEAHLEEAALSVVRWDLGCLDDLVRDLMKEVVRFRLDRHGL